MRIKHIAPSPDRAGRYFVRFDDETTMRLYRQTVDEFGLYSGAELDEEQFRQLQNAAGKQSAKMRAVRILSMSNVSKSDLQNRLVQKGEAPEDAKAAVQWMSEMDLLDDRKTAEQIVDSCIRKGYGLSRAKEALYEKRIPKELWQEVLADYPEQLDKIEEFLCRRLTQDSDEKEIRRAVDALIRRGHSYRRIKCVLETLRFDTDELPEE